MWAGGLGATVSRGDAWRARRGARDAWRVTGETVKCFCFLCRGPRPLRGVGGGVLNGRSKTLGPVAFALALALALALAFAFALATFIANDESGV